MILIRAVIMWAGIVLIASCDGGVSRSDSDGSDGSSLLGLRNKISITGTIKATGGTASADNPIGLQDAANKSVSLFRIDNQGHVVGDVLDTSMSDLEGHYVLVLPEYVGISSDLIVETRLENNRPARAIVIDESTDITPITEYITAKIIADPNLDLRTLPATEVIDLVEFVETLPLTPTSDLGDLLTEIALVADTEVDTEVGGLAVEFNSRVRLSGLLSIPGAVALRNGAYALKPAGEGITIGLYRIDGDGNIKEGPLCDEVETDKDGRYELILCDGLILSSNLILRAEFKTGEYLNALVSSKELDINIKSQFIFNEVTKSPIPINELAPTKILALTTIIVEVDIPETLTFAEALDELEKSEEGAAIVTQIKKNEDEIIAASRGLWGASKWGVSSYQ